MKKASRLRLTFSIAVLLASSLFSQIPAAAKVSSVLPFEDITIKNHKGRIVMANLKGGFRIGEVQGSAELDAAGSVKIERIAGPLRVKTSIGDIEVGDAGGDVRASAGSGNISIEKAAGDVFLQSELGEIIVGSARSIEVLNAQGGDVKVLDVRGHVKVVTKGNISVVWNRHDAGADLCSLASREGDITIYVPVTLGADIEISVPLSEDSKRESHFESDFSFTRFDQRCLANQTLILTAQINGGGAKIHLEIERGNVYLRAATAERLPRT
jgi:acetolactate synthase regulatory subunit